MPILLKVDELEPGMCLAQNIMNMYSVLLPHGRRLVAEDIDSLKKRFAHISVAIVDPILDDVIEFASDTRDHEVSLEVRKNIASVTQKVSSMVRAGVAIKKDQLEGMEKVVESMMDYLQNNPVTMAVVEQSASWDNYIREHSANVFYLSILIGNTIKNYIKRERERLSAAKSLQNAMDITPLAAAAMFHDIGMAPIEQLYQKKEPLTDPEKKTVFEHPAAGADMLPEQMSAMVKLIIRTHHENFLGTGYPNQVPGDKINIFAKIIRVADAYSSAISSTIYSQAANPITILHQMLYGDHAQFYDPVILKVFASIIQPFPIGAKIKLSDNRCAVVVRHNAADCFNPLVIIAYDPFGDPLSKEQLKPPYALKDDPNAKPLSFGDIDVSFIADLPEEIGPASNDTEHAPPQNKYETILDFAYP